MVVFMEIEEVVVAIEEVFVVHGEESVEEVAVVEVMLEELMKVVVVEVQGCGAG